MREICSYNGQMNRGDEKRIAAKMAKTLAMMCVRNTGLETLHAGIVPVTHAGDYSDVRVIDADGREIAWNDVSHLDDGQMRTLMKEIVNRIYTYQLLIDDFEFQNSLSRWSRLAEKWDEPKMDQAFIGALARREG